jgi:hypothetical protein
VEYRALQLMPWVLMHRGPTPAAESIFLDYLSQWNVVSLYKSIRSRHFLVSLCVAGSLLLNAVTVLSTGLFELDSVPITRDIDLTATHEFNASNWDPVWNDARPLGACMGYIEDELARPIGIHDPYVYPPFQSAHQNTNSTMSANIKYEANLDVFEPTLECSNATVKLVPSHDNTTTFAQLDSYVGQDGCAVVIDRIPNVLTTTPGIVVDTLIAGCKGEMLEDTYGDKPNVSWSVDWRLWAAIAPSMLSEEDDAANNLNVTGWEHRKIEVVMCKPGYALSRGPVKIWRDAGQNDISTSIQPDALTPTHGIANVTGGKLLYAAAQAMAIGSSEFTEAYVNGASAIYASNHTRKELWNNLDEFAVAIEDSFTCIMRQIAKDSLLLQSPHNIEGTERVVEQRLFVRPLSFWLMAVCMAFLAADAGILLFFYTPVAVCPRDTGSVAGLSLVFARSTGFMDKFYNCDLKTGTQMEHSSLGQGRYQSQITNTGAFTLVPCGDASDLQDTRTVSERTQVVWWRPASSSWYIQLPLIIIPVAVIAGLETVYHISESHHGIAMVEGDSPYTHYVWVYVPAIILFGIRCFFQSVEFGARMVQPYFRLRQASAPPETSILENQLRKISLYGLWDSFRKGQWALTAATLSLLLGAVLPIVVSGLYTTGQSEPDRHCQLVQDTRWSLGDPTYDGLDETAYWNDKNFKKDVVTGMIIHLNMSYPQWTYKDLAFPSFSLADAQNFPTKGHIDARLPALRGQLHCEEAKGVNWTYGEDTPNTWEGHQTTKCPSWVNSIECPGEETYDFFGTRDWVVGCPTHAMIFSKCDPQNAYYNNTANFHVMNCFAEIEEVDVDIRLQIPSFSFDPDYEPKVVDNSSRILNNTGLASFIGFKDMEKYLFDIKPLTGSYPESSDGNPVIDALIYGVDGVPADELMDPAKLVSRVNEIFGVITAQALSNAGNQPFDKPFNSSYTVSPMTSTPPVFKAVFYDERKYLIQNEISTRILDGVIAAMVLCAVVSLVFMQTKRVLPKCPSSIAAIASLVHGSKMVDPNLIPEGSEWCNDNDLKSRGVFAGQTFTMGWWSREGLSDGEYANPGDSSSTLGSFTKSAGQREESHGKTFGIDFDLDEEKSNLIRP